MKYSVYYRIQNRDEFFEKFFKKFSIQFDKEMIPTIQDKYEDLMENIVKYIIDEDEDNLSILLTKPNAKVARIFFDYLTLSTIKNKKKSDIENRVKEVFDKENDNMEGFKQFLQDKFGNKDVFEDLENEKPNIHLNEADDDDPFGDDEGGGSDGGGDPFGDSEPSGGEGGGSSGETGDLPEDEEKTDDEKKAEELDLEGHEDDPDFYKGVENKDDVTLSDTPSGECIYDVDGVMQSINAVISSTKDTDLAEIVPVKKAVELIFNGKKLKIEDVTFTNPQNAAYLIKKIGSNVDEKTKNYLFLKIKKPLEDQRDQNKLDIANLKKDVETARDTIENIDKE